jgi:hypothetical protein
VAETAAGNRTGSGNGGKMRVFFFQDFTTLLKKWYHRSYSRDTHAGYENTPQCSLPRGLPPSFIGSGHVHAKRPCLRIIIDIDNKKMVLEENGTNRIFYNFDEDSFRFSLFFQRWLNLLHTIQKNRFSERTQKIHLWHIAAPKSGSTWLKTILTELLDWKVCPLIPLHKGREQEIETINLLYSSMQDFCFSPQQHCRYSDSTKRIIERLEIKPVLQYRNIFDAVISFYDHCNEMGLIFPMAYMDEHNWKGLSDTKKLDFVIDLIVPWYFNFYGGWFSSDLIKDGKILLVSYEDLIADPHKEVKRILDWIGIEKTDDEIHSSILSAAQKKTRKNVGISGRGVILSNEQKQKIRTMASYYPQIDFSILGL